jgi:cobalt-zinc-cadmium efflux system outer membrane protein
MRWRNMVLKIATCILLLAALLHGCADAADISLRFDEIGEYALANSPHAYMLERDLDFMKAQRDASLQWSNPELVWEFEQVENESLTQREYTFLLEKEFTLPWVALRERGSWNLRLEAARHRKTADTWRLLAMLRHGYSSLKIYQTEAEYLEKFELLMERASTIADARKREGAISGVEQHLIEMSLLGIRSRIQENRDEYRTHMAEWKTAMGIPEETTVGLETEIKFSRGDLDVQPGSATERQVTADLTGRRLEAEALDKDIQMEKGGILPSIAIAGGYKNVDDGFEGFVIGLSMPLPLLNRNSGDVDRARAEHARAQRQLDLYQSAWRRRLTLLARSAGEKAELLERYIERIENIDEHIEDLVMSYSEGWMTLTGLLEGIEVYTEGLGNYFGLLREYYATVFELEALTERELVNPAVQEREDTDQ